MQHQSPSRHFRSPAVPGIMNVTGAQQDILIHLHQKGDNIPANIADDTGHHRNSITRAVRPLESEGYVVNKGRGVYRLTEKGREKAIDLLSDS